MKPTLGCQISKECYITLFKLLVGILFLIFVFLSGYQIYVSHLPPDDSLPISDGTCQQSIEERLLDYMNFSVDPCSNFYEFACGNWIQYHSMLNHSFYISSNTELKKKMLRKIEKFLRKPNSPYEPEVVHEARKMYKSCVHPKITNEDSEFQDIINILQLLQLPPVPDFSTESKKFSWTSPTILSKKILNEDLFFQFSIRPDPYLVNENAIYIASPSSKFYSNLERNSAMFDTPRNTFYEFFKDVTMYMYQKLNLTWSTHTEYMFDDRFLKVIEFAARVDKLDEASSGSYLGEYVSIDDLQEMTDKIFEQYKDNSNVSQNENNSAGQSNIFGIFSHIFTKKTKFGQLDWEMYFFEIFNESRIHFDLQNDDKTILVPDRLYLQEILKLIAQTPSHILELYMWWKIMFTLLPYSNHYLVERYDQYFIKFFNKQRIPRNLYCTELVNDAFDYATSYFIIDSYTLQQKIPKVSEIYKNVKNAFAEEINNSTWLDDDTRTAALKKLNAIKVNIGYPEWMNDSQRLDQYYGVVIMDRNNLIQNVLKVKKRDFEKIINVYKTTNDYKKENPWIGHVMEVNAFYYSFYNNIIIPAGLLHYPFYDFATEAMNYGAVGMIIGHELTHGFDKAGKEFDGEGHLRSWWSNRTELEYEKRIQCFINSYNQYNFNIDARSTLNENIADHGGLKIAFKAYKKYVKEPNIKEISSVLNYTSEQLFYLAFAQGRCEHISEQFLKLHLTNKYGPSYTRVITTLRNSQEFSKAWKCEIGSPMNPDVEKCQLW